MASKKKRPPFESTIAKSEVDRAIAELTEMGVGTSLDLPAAILHRLRAAIEEYERGSK